MCRSPKLFAACHVLRRLLMPRHSPCALFRLTFVDASSAHSVSASGLAASRENFISLRCISSPKQNDVSSRLSSGSLNYAGSYRILLEIVLPCVVASAVSFAPAFPPELIHSAAPPLPRKLAFARMETGGSGSRLRHWFSELCRLIQDFFYEIVLPFFEFHNCF